MCCGRVMRDSSRLWGNKSTIQSINTGMCGCRPPAPIVCESDTPSTCDVLTKINYTWCLGVLLDVLRSAVPCKCRLRETGCHSYNTEQV